MLVVLDVLDRDARENRAAVGPYHVDQSVDEARPAVVQVQHAVQRGAQLHRRRARVEQTEVGAVRRGPHDRGHHGPPGVVVGHIVDPVLCRSPGPLGGGSRAEPAEGASDPQAVPDLAAQEAARRLRPTGDEHAGPVDPRPAPADAHAQAPQHVEPADGPIQGVRPEVDVEPVPVPAARPPADVVGGLDDGHCPSRPGECRGGGQPGQPATDDDRGLEISCCLHVTETIDPPAL